MRLTDIVNKGRCIARRLEIRWYKHRAKVLYLEISKMSEIYDAGEEIVDFISGGRLTYLKERLAKTMEVLSEIDPDYMEPVN